MLAAQPAAKWIQWEPVNRDNARAGARAAFGQYVEPVYDDPIVAAVPQTHALADRARSVTV